MENTTRTNKNKATHSGHCQACGRLQRLPNGKLSLHGYKVLCGFFSGTCAGSKHLPFELSCDMLPGFIAAAKSALESIEETQAKLRVPATAPKGWVSNYEGDTYGRNEYRWREVEIHAEERVSGDFRWLVFTYVANGTNGKKDVTHKIETYGFDVKSTLDLATILNGKRADAMESEAKNLRRYIAWQEERVRTWAPAALLPVKVDWNEAHSERKADTEGFTLDEA